jgi:hypothetical protein
VTAHVRNQATGAPCMGMEAHAILWATRLQRPIFPHSYYLELITVNRKFANIEAFSMAAQGDSKRLALRRP